MCVRVALCTMKIVATPYPRSPQTRQAKGGAFEGSDIPNQHYRKKSVKYALKMHLPVL